MSEKIKGYKSIATTMLGTKRNQVDDSKLKKRLRLLYLDSSLLPKNEFELQNSIINHDICERYMKDIIDSVPFQIGMVRSPQGMVQEPRMTALYGKEIEVYAYSGKTMKALKLDTNETVQEIFSLVEKHIVASFDIVLINYYRNGQDSVSWHSDDEESIDPSLIASLSFGATRKFQIKEIADESKRWQVMLCEGDLLLMKGEFQQKYHHQVPKQVSKVNPVGARINFTFRKVKK